MIVNRDPNVVLLHEFLHSRQVFRRRIPRHNHLHSRSLAVFELRPDISIVILLEIDRPNGVQFDPSRSVIGQSRHFLLRIHRQMIFHVFRIQREDMQFLHEADQLGPAEVAKRIARQAETDRSTFIAGGPVMRLRPVSARRNDRCSRNHRTRPHKLAARELA